MRGLGLVVLAGCGFTHGTGPDAGSASDVMPGSDAPRDTFVGDTACPDDDGDTICNAVDDWPCGVKPTAPPSTVTLTANGGATDLQITQTSLGGTGLFAVAAANATISLAFHFNLDDTACPGNCIDQIEVGWSAPGGRTGCPFDATVSRSNGASGNLATTIQVPAGKQAYDLRINIGQNFSCTANGANSWWGSAPAADHTTARLCVH